MFFCVTVGYCAFPQDFHARKFGEFLVFYEVDNDNETFFKFVQYLVTLCYMVIIKGIEYVSKYIKLLSFYVLNYNYSPAFGP